MGIKKKLLAATLLLAIGGQAHAEYMELDWQEEGDGRAFLDMDTGIEWLKLGETVGYSINSVSDEFGAGGEFEGWRLATRSEVTSIAADLIDYQIKEGETYANWSSSDQPQIYEDFMSLFGMTLVNDDYLYSYGYYKNDFTTAGLSNNVLMTGVLSSTGTRLYEDYEHSSYSYNNIDNIVGVYLVADGGATLTTQANMSLVANNPNAAINNVSGPVGALLMTAGLFGLGAVRRRPR
jgi:hypothetical protein